MLRFRWDRDNIQTFVQLQSIVTQHPCGTAKLTPIAHASEVLLARGAESGLFKAISGLHI